MATISENKKNGKTVSYRFIVCLGRDAQKKQIDAATRILKKMKADGRIQFFATTEGFASLKTEAVFLQNKYPDQLSFAVNSEEEFIYVKL